MTTPPVTDERYLGIRMADDRRQLIAALVGDLRQTDGQGVPEFVDSVWITTPTRRPRPELEPPPRLGQAQHHSKPPWAYPSPWTACMAGRLALREREQLTIDGVLGSETGEALDIWSG